MAEPIVLALTPAQRAEFQRLQQQENDARVLLTQLPIARNYAARAIVLGQYALEQFDNQNLAIDLNAGTITFALNEAPVE